MRSGLSDFTRLFSARRIREKAIPHISFFSNLFLFLTFLAIRVADDRGLRKGTLLLQECSPPSFPLFKVNTFPAFWLETIELINIGGRDKIEILWVYLRFCNASARNVRARAGRLPVNPQRDKVAAIAITTV